MRSVWFWTSVTLVCLSVVALGAPKKGGGKTVAEQQGARAARREKRAAAGESAKAAMGDPKPLTNYQPVTAAGFVAPTPALNQRGEVEVFGQPRTTEGHPCTLWDNQDIAHFKDLRKTSKPLQKAFSELKAATDKRMADPPGVPEPRKGRDGQWIFPGDDVRAIYNIHEANAKTLSDLGTMYVLTGEEKYGAYARQMLLAYAEAYPRYGHAGRRGNEWTEHSYRAEFDGRLTGQFLGDGLWLIPVARAYDLVYNLPAWTDAERKKMREGLFEPACQQFVADVLGPASFVDRTHNRSAICTAGVLMAGYACDSQKLINYALYGKGGTKDKPTGGVLGMHFTDRCITPDGLWNEGSMGYQNMARAALVTDAEVMWHHGLDMYSHNKGILKGLFDSQLLYLYPDFSLPSTHDSHRTSFLPGEKKGTDGPHTYEYAFLRYRDPRYLMPIGGESLNLHLSTHHGPTSVLFDQDLSARPAATASAVSANFFSVGYGVLRVGAGKSSVSLLLEFGPVSGHDHPDKLAIDLYALGDVVIPDPGIKFPYDYPLDASWYRTSPGHAMLTVDEQSQIYHGHNPFKSTADPKGKQYVFAPATTLGMQRAASDTVWPGVMQDRAIFVTSDYMVDLFGAFAAAPHKYDLAWHLRGQLTAELPLQPMKFPEPVADGYSALKNVRHVTVEKPWQVTVTRNGKPVRLLAAAPVATEILVGDGFYRLEKEDESVPAIYERRTAATTLFGNALDISGGKEPYVQAVAQEGGLDEGYGLLKVQTSKGTDLCFVSYRPGVYKAAGLVAEATQAFALMEGAAPRAMYLAGRSVKLGNASLDRSEPGLACLERQASGDYVLSNPSATAATFTLRHAVLDGLTPTVLDAQGQPAGPAKVIRTDAGMSLEMPAQSKVHFAAKR